MPNNILPLQTNETIRLVPLIYRVNPFSVQIMSDVIKEETVLQFYFATQFQTFCGVD